MSDMSNRTWTEEDEYWRTNFGQRPYASNSAYDRWRPAYRFGYESASRYSNRSWDEVERDLERDWSTSEYGGDERSTWQQMKDAVRDAWNRATGKY